MWSFPIRVRSFPVDVKRSSVFSLTAISIWSVQSVDKVFLDHFSRFAKAAEMPNIRSENACTGVFWWASPSLSIHVFSCLCLFTGGKGKVDLSCPPLPPLHSYTRLHREGEVGVAGLRLKDFLVSMFTHFTWLNNWRAPHPSTLWGWRPMCWKSWIPHWDAR